MVGAASEAARRRFFCLTAAALCGLVLAASGAARAESVLVPAFAERSLRGPAEAKGAVIWSHGKGPTADEAKAANPPYLALLADAGWDVFRNNRLGELAEFNEPRPSLAAQIRSKTGELADAADRLRAEGYRKIALAGQSFGAWLSLALADKRSDLYAVIATAPAAYGNRQRNPDHYANNRLYLADLIDGLEVGRVLVAFFRDDPFDPGGRGPATEESLLHHHIAHLVIDQPEVPTGHGGANNAFFARRFGACVLAVLEAPQVPALADCASKEALAPSGAVPLPAALTLARTADADAARPFLGEWWGLYGNGREMILALERVEGDRVHAVYAFGPLGPESGGFTARAGHLADGRLLFDELGKPRLEYRLAPDGTLAAEWQKGDTTLTAHLRRVSP